MVVVSYSISKQIDKSGWMSDKWNIVIGGSAAGLCCLALHGTIINPTNVAAGGRTPRPAM